jgi:hypothetical protein
MRNFITSLVIVLSFTSAATSSAALLPIGGIHFPVDDEAGPAGATLVSSTGVLPFGTANYTGTLVSSVYSNDPNNTFPGGLTFTYLLHNDATSNDALERITIINFAAFSTDVSYQAPVAVGDVIPSYVDRSVSGGTIGFSYAPYALGKLSPGKTSALLIVRTDATAYFPSVASVIDGLATQVDSFSPAIPVINLPEPGAIGLSIVGITAVAFFARRRKVSI